MTGYLAASAIKEADSPHVCRMSAGMMEYACEYLCNFTFLLNLNMKIHMEKQDVFLHRTYVALTNVLNSPELLVIMAQYSFDEKKIREGLKMHGTVDTLTLQREQAQSAQYQATQLLTQAKEDLLNLFRKHLETARLAYLREAADYQDTLHITAIVPRATVDCLKHIKRFYAHIPVPMMEKYLVPQKELTEANRLAQRVKELLALQIKAKSQPQHLSDARQKAFTALKAWMYRFDKIAQLAFDDQPQQLEALGQTVR